MTVIQGTLQNMGSVVRQGANGPWTKHTLTIDGKDYQCHTPVMNAAQGRMGQIIEADVSSKEKDNGFTDWYVNAIFGPGEAPTRPDTTGVAASGTTTTSPSRPSGTLTEMGKNASICRQVAAKLLVEAGVPPGSQVFWLEIGPIARYFATGERPEAVENLTAPPGGTPNTVGGSMGPGYDGSSVEPKPSYINQEQIDALPPFDDNQYAEDESIPF